MDGPALELSSVVAVVVAVVEAVRLTVAVENVGWGKRGCSRLTLQGVTYLKFNKV
jgi:hypothetical protein